MRPWKNAVAAGAWSPEEADVRAGPADDIGTCNFGTPRVPLGAFSAFADRPGARRRPLHRVLASLGRACRSSALCFVLARPMLAGAACPAHAAHHMGRGGGATRALARWCHAATPEGARCTARLVHGHRPGWQTSGRFFSKSPCTCTSHGTLAEIPANSGRTRPTIRRNQRLSLSNSTQLWLHTLAECATWSAKLARPNRGQIWAVGRRRPELVELGASCAKLVQFSLDSSNTCAKVAPKCRSRQSQSASKLP